ncbi:MAG: hypothetical protein FWC20_10970 [Oscillospiraceae bacterium]|nr:hypothetical protein [Oscillospiraceae bacterium]MCL2279908.1 hypothetical protein [Oscillospiraceae bacterium]
MTAYVRRRTTSYGYDKFYAFEGSPENHCEDTKVIAEGNTRRQAIRNAKLSGYDVIIKSITQTVENPLSIPDTLMQVAEPNADRFTWETSALDRSKAAQLAFADYGGAVSEPTVAYNSTSQSSTKLDFSKVQTWGKSKSETEAEELKVALNELDNGIKQAFENDGYEHTKLYSRRNQPH